MNDTFGGRLRHERERRQIALRSIAESTKIGISLLDGLEADDVSRWPSGIYRKSFVRAYAQAIGVDPEPVVREFAELYPDPQDATMAQPDAPPGIAPSTSGPLPTKPTTKPPSQPIAARSILLTVNLPGTAFTRGKFLRDVRKRWAAAACDAAVSCVIALCAFIILGHFWTPLGVSMLCYYAGGVVLLGNTPGVYLFAPEPQTDTGQGTG
ncbi:MAG TPA: helix-turn-helix domain-containing protein [Vicinamibacterales bacterium]|nr:helix-turn-helix domain-containing protein [Vicinamibacterales bacterium]